jgi:TIR domain
VSAGPTESRSVPGPKVFITYRREETAAHAGRLYDAMVARFGEANVFMDVDMAPGVDFVERITEAVAACHVLIVVMGPRWATVEDEQGRARLADPEDVVRLEVETALRRPDVTPIPVLVAGARMPNREDLPPEVRAITRRNALELDDHRWR